MKVLLLNQAKKGSDKDGAFPASLHSLASMLKEQPRLGLQRLAGVEVQLDTVTTKNTAQVVRRHEADIIGISVYEMRIRDVAQICRDLRKETDATIVLGGPFATLLPNTTLTETGADIVCRGEADFTFRRLVERLSKGEETLGIEGVMKRDRKTRRIITSGKSNEIPRLSKTEMEKIVLDTELARQWIEASDGGYMSMTLARGCPRSCYFCTCSTPSQPRSMGDEEVISRIATSDFPIIDINDPLFGGSRPRLARLLDGIGEHQSEKKIMLWLAVDQILGTGEIGSREPNIEMIEKLKRAGVIGIGLGVESFDDDILRKIKMNKYNGEEAEKVVLALLENGIKTWVHLIMSDVDTTLEQFHATLEKSLDLALRVSKKDEYPADAAFHIPKMMLPLVGTPYYWELINEREQLIASRRESLDPEYPFYDVQPRYLPLLEGKGIRRLEDFNSALADFLTFIASRERMWDSEEIEAMKRLGDFLVDFIEKIDPKRSKNEKGKII